MRTVVTILAILLMSERAGRALSLRSTFWRGLLTRQRASSREESVAGNEGKQQYALEEVRIPEKLFSKQLAEPRRSYCSRARHEFDQLCGLKSAEERVKLAVFVTNCHLEVSGRPIFVWDPIKKLEEADESFVYLVMVFLPMMADVCEKAGHSALLAQMIADTSSNNDMRDKLDELQEATERLLEANQQSSEIISDYLDISIDAKSQALELFNLTEELKKSSNEIDTQQEQILQETNSLKKEFAMFTEESLALYNALHGRMKGFTAYMERMDGTIGQIQADSAMTSMFLKAPLQALSNGSVWTLWPPETNIQMSFRDLHPLDSIRKITIVKNIVLAPIKLSAWLRVLEDKQFVGSFAKDLFTTLHILLLLLSVYIAYVLIVMFTRFLEALYKFVGVFRPLRPILTAPSSLLMTRHPAASDPFRCRSTADVVEETASPVAQETLMTTGSSAQRRNCSRPDDDSKICLILTRLSALDEHIAQISLNVQNLQIVKRDIEILRRLVQHTSPSRDVEHEKLESESATHSNWNTHHGRVYGRTVQSLKGSIDVSKVTREEEENSRDGHVFDLQREGKDELEAREVEQSCRKQVRSRKPAKSKRIISEASQSGGSTATTESESKRTGLRRDVHLRRTTRSASKHAH